MPDKIALRVETPTGAAPPGRGFYQLEEDSLYVQVGPGGPERKYFSYLESEHLRLDLDRDGRLIFVEVRLPRRQWQVDQNLTPPGIGEPGDIRWLEFRQRINDPLFLTDESHSILKIEFQPSDSWRWYLPGENVVVQISPDSTLASIWVTEIVDDLAGKQIGAFRKKLADDLAKENPEHTND